MNSRTYDDQDQGKIIRDGFEPGKVDNGSNDNIAVVDDGGDGKAKASAQYGSLDDRHVWNSGE